MNKPRKSRKKKYNKKANAFKFLNGIKVNWQVKDPLAQGATIDSYTKITHRNTLHLLDIHTIGKLFIEISTKYRLKYRINIDCIFKDFSGKEYIRGREMLVEGLLHDANEHYFEVVQDIFNESNMSQYITTDITVECLGRGNLSTKDFTEEAI